MVKEGDVKRNQSRNRHQARNERIKFFSFDSFNGLDPSLTTNRFTLMFLVNHLSLYDLQTILVAFRF